MHTEEEWPLSLSVLLMLRLMWMQVVSNEARARSQRMTEAAAARIAELSDQVERQQRALR